MNWKKSSALLLPLLATSGLTATLTVPGDYATVHEAVAAAVAGDVVAVSNGTYTFTSTLNIPVGITLDGESEAGTIFEINCGSGYGIHPSVGGVTLQDFTLSIPAASTQSGFIVHASGTPNVQDGLTVENVTIQGSGAAAQRRAGLDIHGYDNVSLSNVSSNDATWGNGIQLTGCSGVTVESCSTGNNAWGSLAIYCSQYLVPTRASSNVTINGDNSVFGEGNVFIENEFGLTCSGITVTGYEYEMRNTAFRTGAENFIFLKDTWADCAALAAAFVGFEDATTINEIATGNFIVDAALGLTIQTAIDAANSGDTIDVSAGSYAENLILNKALTLNGANANAACDARAAESVIAPASGLPVSITADGVSFNGFEVTAPGYQYGIILSGTSDVAVIHNNVHDINSSATPVITNTYGIYYSVPNVDANSNVTISDNCLDNIASSALTGNSCAAIGVLQSTSTGTLSNLTIAGNSITDVAVNTGAWPTGKIAYGMILNTGSSSYLTTTGKIVDAIIENNVIDGLSGFISTAIGLEGNTENAIVRGNTIANLYGAKTADRAGGGYDLNGLKFESNRYVGTVTVENNSIDRSTFNHNGTMDRGYAVANYVPVGAAYSGGTTAAANVTCNWFGTADADAIADAEDLTGSILNKVGAESTFIPFLTTSDIENPTCMGGLVAHNITQGTHYATIQAAIDAANSGDTIEVDAGTHAEALVIDRSIVLSGPNALISPNTGVRVAEAVVSPPVGSHAIVAAAGNITVSIAGFSFDMAANQLDDRFVQIINQPNSSWTFEHNEFTNGPTCNNGAWYCSGNNGNWTMSIIDNHFYGNADSNGISIWSTGTNNVVITDNIFEDNQAYALNLNRVVGTISGNIIRDNLIEGAAWWEDQSGIILAATDNDISISNNTFENLAYVGLYLYDGFAGTANVTNNLFDGIAVNANDLTVPYAAFRVRSAGVDISGVTFAENTILDSPVIVRNPTATVFDATCNWYGSAAGPDAGQFLEGDVDYLPWLTSSGATECTGGYTVHNITQGTHYETIQAAIDAANSGDTITLDAVTFEPVSQVQVNKSISLIGAGSASTTIDVGGYNAWGIYVSASDVTLEGFTMLGDPLVNQQYGLHADPGITNITYTDITATGTKRTAIDLNGVDGAVLTDIVANGATSGFGFAISSSRNVTVTNLSCTGNAWGAVGVFPANTPYQLPGLEEPTAITFAGTLSLDGGAGAISVQDGALASGGTWTATISTNAADNADVTVPASFSHVVHSTRIDGLVMHNATTQATAYTMAPMLEAYAPVGTFSGTYIQDIVNGDLEVIPGLRVEAAVNGAAGGEDINIAAGTYTLLAQSLLDVDVNLLGAGSDLTFLEAGYNTGTSAYSETSALLHVAAGVTAEIRDLSISGAGFTVNQAIQSRGDSLTVADCVISNISSSAGSYDGRGIVFLTGGGLVDGCTLSDIYRIGVHIRGAVVSPAPVVLVDGLTYTGKGDGDWLDYGVEFGGGGQGEVRNSMITACTGVAYDGSTSGGILVTDYYGTFTIAEINSSILTGNSTGVVVGYAEADISDVTIRGCSIFDNTEFGVTSTGVEVDAISNWWGAVSGPYHPTTNALGTGNEVSDNVLFDPWLAGEYDITQSASETLISVADGAQYTDETVVTYSIAPAISGATAWRQVTVWVAWNASFVNPTSLNGLFSHSDGVFFDYDLGANPMEVSVSILGGLTEGQLAAADLFTVTFDGVAEPASPFTTDLSISSAVVRSLVNVTIPSSTDDAVSLTVDGTAPAAITDAWLVDSCINTDITGTITAIDNVELYNVEYQILPGGSWAEALPANLEGASLAPQNYTVDVSGLADGDYTLQFRVNDEVGYIGDVAEYSFHLDTVAPTAASALDADPGHQFVDLAWEHGSGHDGYKVYRALRVEAYPYPGAGETTVNVYGTDTFTLVADLAPTVNTYIDNIAARGIYDYAVVAYDCVNDDAAAAIGAATNYFLGDWAGNDGFVSSPDLAELSTSYGSDAGEGAFDAEHDVAPTSDYSSYGLPEPDSRINFEDLIIFAMNYGPSGPQLPQDSRGGQPGNTIELVQGEEHPELLLPALAKGVSVRVACEATLQSVIGALPAFFYNDGEAWVVDVVAFGSTIPANSRVELVFAGEAAQPVILDADARDAWNNSIELSIENSLSAELPLAFELGQNFPNPFNPATQIRFALPEDANVRLVLFNSLGQEVKTVLDASLEAGYHEVRLDASGLASGVYFYRMQAGNFTDLKKMVVLK